jgi:hypothetical protein
MRKFSISERQGDFGELLRQAFDNFGCQIRVAMPGVVTAFNTTQQTVNVQLAITERIADTQDNINQITIPELLDVPLVLPRAGGFCLTFPVQVGDECLVVFADMCIDAWWSNGKVQNQIERRRHDLSDAFAILGTWSQPHRISNYSANSAQLRSESGASYIDIKAGEINIVSPTVKINGTPV